MSMAEFLENIGAPGLPNFGQQQQHQQCGSASGPPWAWTRCPERARQLEMPPADPQADEDREECKAGLGRCHESSVFNVNRWSPTMIVYIELIAPAMICYGYLIFSMCGSSCLGPSKPKKCLEAHDLDTFFCSMYAIRITFGWFLWQILGPKRPCFLLGSIGDGDGVRFGLFHSPLKIGVGPWLLRTTHLR